jgi:hypothetical protein
VTQEEVEIARQQLVIGATRPAVTDSMAKSVPFIMAIHTLSLRICTMVQKRPFLIHSATEVVKG